MTLPDFLVYRNGGIDLSGSRVSLYNVISEYVDGMPAEQIAEEFPSLSLSMIYRTLAFYLDNRSEVDRYLKDCRGRLDAMQQAAAPFDIDRLRSRFEKLNVQRPKAEIAG